MMIKNFYALVKTNHNHISDHPYRILIIADSWSGKTNTLLNLTNYKPEINESLLNTKDSFESKNQLLTNKREKAGIKHLKFPKAFTYYSETTD